MNTQKVKTQSVSTPSEGLSRKNRKFFLNYCHLFVYIYSLIMYIALFGCLFIRDWEHHYNCYFHDGSLSAGGICLVIFGIMSIIFTFFSFLINRIVPNKSKFSYMIKDAVFINLANLYLVLMGAFTGMDTWLWSINSSSVSFGGANIIIVWIVFSLYLIWSQINHFKGDKIRAWFKKHNPIKSKNA